MLNKIKILLFAALFAFTFKSTAYTLPVTFHVLYSGGPSNQALVDMICDVNEIFAGQEPSITSSFPYLSLVNNSGIKFQVTGIVRPTTFPSTGMEVCNPSSTPYIFSSYPPVPGTVNIYIYNYTYTSNPSTGAYIFPTSGCSAGAVDLIVIKPGAFIKDIVCHELGHYLNLPHVSGWGPGGPVFSGYENCTDYDPTVIGACPGVNSSTHMPQNIMQPSTNGCRVFFTPCQTANMRRMCDISASPGGYRAGILLDNISATAGTNYNAACNNSKWLMPYFTETSRGIFNAVVPKCAITPTYSWVLDGWCAGGHYWFNISSGSTTTLPINTNIASQPGCTFRVTITCDYGSGWTNSKEFICPGTSGAFCSIGCPAPPGDGRPEGTTSISMVNPIDAIFIRPNPVQNEIIVDNYSLANKFAISNLIGQVLLKGETSNSIDVSGLPKGNYFIQFRDQSGQIKTIKFIK